MDFDLNDNQKLVKETVKKLAQKELAPRAAEVDRKQTFPWEGIRMLAKADLMSLAIPSEYGGTNLDTLSFIIATEEIAKACGSTALIFATHNIVAKTISIFGTDLQKAKYLPQMSKATILGAFCVHESGCGSVATAIETKAVPKDGHYIVNGSKVFVTNASEAGVYLVLVRTRPFLEGNAGISMLIVEKDTSGLSFGKLEEKLGLNGTSSREIYFQDLKVPQENLLGKEGEGLKVVAEAIIRYGFFGAAAISLGLSEIAFEEALKHAKQRTIITSPIGLNQAIQHIITDMALNIDAARSLLYLNAWEKDKNPKDFSILGALKAKLYASEMAIDVTDKAIQIFGGHGYCKDYSIERLFRDARGLTLHFKTTEHLKNDIGKALIEI